jgi:3-oxoacyl-[acyl-carrier-protein] synthase II
MRQRVVITGIGSISCFGVGPEAFYDGVRSGRTGIAPIEAFDTTGCHAHAAAMIRGFDPAAFIAPIKLRRFDRAGRLATACTRLTFEDAAYSTATAGDDTGIALGTVTAGLDSVVEYMTGLTDRGPMGVPAILFSNTVANAPASLCAIEFGLRGPNVTFNQREASSVAAIAFAAGAIRDGRTTAMISGGIDCLEEPFFKTHDRFRALSPMRATSAGVRADEGARPFDRCRNGLVLGEGGFLLLFEDARSAEARRATVYGEVLGVAMTSSPTGLNEWPSEPSGLVRAMELALSDADMERDAIDVVMAAANGSPHVDRLEAEALSRVFGSRGVPVASIKGAVGESGSAGAASLVAGLFAAAEGVVVPTAGFASPDPACDVDVSGALRIHADDARSRHAPAPDVFMINSVAIGGTIGSLVVRAARHG